MYIRKSSLEVRNNESIQIETKELPSSYELKPRVCWLFDVRRHYTGLL